jgi:hypothetical protein
MNPPWIDYPELHPTGPNWTALSNGHWENWCVAYQFASPEERALYRQKFPEPPDHIGLYGFLRDEGGSS